MSEYVQRDFCCRIAKALEAVDALHGAKIVVEDLGDVDAEITKASVGVVVAIAATGHARGNGSTLSGRLDIDVLCSERPKVNRAGGRKDFLSAQNAAEIVARALDHLKIEGFGTLVYESMRRQDEGDRAQTFVALHAEQSIDPSQALCWGLADGSQAYGEIVTRRVVRNGTPVFEAGRDGADRWTATRNRHLAIDITANVPVGTEELPDIGDAFTCPVNGVMTTFVCTASDDTETVNEKKTLHLAGRTMPGITPKKGQSTWQEQ